MLRIIFSIDAIIIQKKLNTIVFNFSYQHLSKSSELLNEKYPVVQLSYQQGLLLVSTVFRTILVNRNQKDKVSQVGQKERKTLVKSPIIFSVIVVYLLLHSFDIFFFFLDWEN